MSKQIYMDYAAASPVNPKVLQKMLPYYTQDFHNPSAIYLSGKAVSKDIEQARTDVARVLGAKPVEIIFTAGATEANNLAIVGLMQKYPDSEVLVSAIEHDSVIEPSKLFNNKQIKVKADGRVDLEHFRKSITDKTVLVSVMFANNEIGVISPIKKVAKILDEVRQKRIKEGNKLPLFFHTDASQAPLYLDLHIDKLGVDMMSLNGGKIYGPKQSGCLYVRTGINLKPLISGGGQERKLRSGTENVPNIIGFSEALLMAQGKHKNNSLEVVKLRDYFIESLENKIDDTQFNGSLEYRLPNNIHITILGIDNERMIMELDEKGILCAAGSACSASSDAPSHVLTAIGISEKDAQSSLRFTIGKSTTKQEIDFVVTTLKEILSRQ